MSGTISPNLLVEASMNYDGNTIDITNSAIAASPPGWNSRRSHSSTRSPSSLAGVDWRLGPSVLVAEDLGSAPWHNAAQDYMPKAIFPTPWASTP